MFSTKIKKALLQIKHQFQILLNQMKTVSSLSKTKKFHKISIIKIKEVIKLKSCKEINRQQ